MSQVSGIRLFLLSSIVSATAVFSQTSRPFKMASGAIQAFPQDQGVIFQNSWSGFTFGDLAQDVDIINVQPEYLGIPFATFAESPDLPDGDPWAQQMVNLANAAKTPGRPLLVQIALVRAVMVGNAIYPDGLVQVKTDWAPSCPDLTSSAYDKIEQSYINYALWVARTFSPRYFVIMLEPNLYYSNCGGDSPTWQLLVKIERDVYRAVKAAYPFMILFPSFNLEAVYGQNVTGFDQAHYDAILGMKRDRLGLVSFPQIAANPYQLPVDYFTRIQDRNPNEPPVVITETGWNSSTISIQVSGANICNSTVGYSQPSFETAFLNFVIYSGYSGNFDVITWWSDRDEIPAGVIGTCYPPATPPDFPECNGDVWCAAVSSVRAYPPPGSSPEFGEIAFKAFGTMGLRNYDGTPKDETFALWQQFQQLPIISNAGSSPTQRSPLR